MALLKIGNRTDHKAGKDDLNNSANSHWQKKSALGFGKGQGRVIGAGRRIYWSVSSEGYGHSSRAIALAKEFDTSEVLVGSYNYALERMRQFGLPGVVVPQELELIGSAGTFDVGKTILHNRTKALGLNQIVQEEMDIMTTYGISLVVADGRIAPVLAASRLDIPCLVMTNQSAFYPFFEQDSPLVQWFGRSFEWVMKLWLASAAEILIPDFPPPDTVCLPNLSRKYQVKKRTRFIGPLVNWNPDDIQPIERHPNKPLVVASLGGHAYRKPLFDAVVAMAAETPEIDYKLLTTFETDQLTSNVQCLSNVMNAESYFKSADLVITQGGHSTAMELLTLGRPSLVVPDKNQREQENNASRLVEFGVAEHVGYEDLQDGNGQPSFTILKNVMQTMLNNESYRLAAKEFAEKAAVIQGAKNGARVLREYAGRLVAY